MITCKNCEHAIYLFKGIKIDSMEHSHTVGGACGNRLKHGLLKGESCGCTNPEPKEAK